MCIRGSYELMKKSGAVFNEEPRVEEYGTVVVFQDLYGNKSVSYTHLTLPTSNLRGGGGGGGGG
ncbi:hypothetical protein ACRTC5_23695, partial [Vibrio alginolyticus]